MNQAPSIVTVKKRPAKILVVDDSPSSVSMLVQFLDADYSVITATNGRDALRVARSECPELILLDLIMPGMDGYEVCRRLKSDPKTEDIAIIFITSDHTVENEIRGFELGGVDFITKPFSHTVVERRVRTQVELIRFRESFAERKVSAERARIARDFHDAQAQTLAAASVHLEAMRDCASPLGTDAAHHLDRVRELLRFGLQEAQRAIANHMPERLELLDLAEALRLSGEDLTGPAGIDFRFSTTGRPVELPDVVRTNLYFLGQEAMANAVRHAGPGCVDCNLVFLPHAVSLTVSDDGCGFDPAIEFSFAHRGLRNLRERVDQLAGNLAIESASGATVVAIWIPL